MTKERKQEFTLRITQANKTGLIVILYDMVLTYLEDACRAHENNQMEEYKKNITRAKDCLDELLHSLHYEYELASVLRGLYYFYKRQLSTAAVLGQKEILYSVMEMVKELKESYEQILSQDTSAPLMENTQAVYTGFTYGKDSLNVNLTHQSMDRGFRV